MQKAIDQLRDSNGLMLDEKVHITASYDGAYQKRSSKIGGGFSRFCFVSLIDMSTGKVVCYDVACNSCPKCTDLRHQLRAGKLSPVEYQAKFDLHLNTCPANYRDFSSVSLESEIIPEILTQAFDRGIICDGILCDEDNKTIEKIKEVDPYANFGLKHDIKRIECLSHCCKRMKAHLIESQKSKLRLARQDKAAKVSAGVSKSKIQKEFAGKLVRQNISRG